MSMGAFAARMGQGKNKSSASRLARILLFFCLSQFAGIICLARARSLRPSGYLRYASSRMPKALGCADPVNPWLVSFQSRSARSLLKINA
jgi:hypothetical protein